MVFLIKFSCACVGVNKLSDLTTCTVQIQSFPTLLKIHFLLFTLNAYYCITTANLKFRSNAFSRLSYQNFKIRNNTDCNFIDTNKS